jgi:hypothetical protein
LFGDVPVVSGALNNEQKFFVSFFQKRNTSLLSYLAAACLRKIRRAHGTLPPWTT